MEAEPPKRKRRFQFSLRTLLVIVALVAVPCAWLGRKIDRKRKERDAVAAIAKMGGRVFFDFQRDPTMAPPPGGLGPSASSGPWRAKAEPFGPVWLRNLLGNAFFSEVDAVWLNSATVTDEDLVKLRGLLWLQDLSLAGTKVTDAGLANLEPLTRLRSLNLNQTAISDAGLVHLSAM